MRCFRVGGRLRFSDGTVVCMGGAIFTTTIIPKRGQFFAKAMLCFCDPEGFGRHMDIFCQGRRTASTRLQRVSPPPPFEKDWFQAEKLIVLGVVATVDTKMWSLENYCLLARNIRRHFPQWKIVVPLPSSDRDCERKLLQLDFPKGLK